MSGFGSGFGGGFGGPSIAGNLDFETAGTDPGEAAGWVISSTTSTVFEVAGFDGDTLGFEAYESGWGSLLLAFLDSDLATAEFENEPIEDYERVWGPFDGSDPNYATKVQAAANFGDNAGFIFDFSLLAAAQFDSAIVGQNFEDYEDGWPDNESFVFNFVGVPTDLAPALFGTGLDLEEGYENEWQSNESFKFNFVGIGTDLEAALFDATVPQTVEDYEEVIDGDEVFEITVGIAGDWLLEIDGVIYTFPSGGADTTTIRNGLRDAVNNGNQQVLASNGPGTDQVLIKNLSTDLNPRSMKGTAPGGGTIERVTEASRVDFWLQPLLGF